MSRLQKKCFIASAGMHLLLLAIILVGPAFVSGNTTEVREITFVPRIVLAEDAAGGGNPNGGQRAAVVTPTPARPQPPPEPKPEPNPPPKAEPQRTEVAKTAPPDPDDFGERKTKLPPISTKLVTRRVPSSRTAENSREAENQQRRAEEEQRTLARGIADAVAAIRGGSPSATAIDVDIGPGGGGPSYGGYDSFVQKIYQDAWVKPEDTSSDALVTVATVTIARDGSVVAGSARIISRSGDSQMDSSVQRTLDRVTNIGRPFPDAMKEKQKTYTLKFDLKKRSLT